MELERSVFLEVQAKSEDLAFVWSQWLCIRMPEIESIRSQTKFETKLLRKNARLWLPEYDKLRPWHWAALHCKKRLDH